MNEESVMEFEAKFRIEDERLINRLQARKTLGRRYRLGPTESSEIVDLYLDTADAKLLRTGYTLRFRRKGDKNVATLKALRNDNGESLMSALHARYELEKPISSDKRIRKVGKKTNLNVLPKDVKKVVSQIVGKDATLSPLCSIQQTRHTRSIVKSASSRTTIDRAEGVVLEEVDDTAIMSIDEVRIFDSILTADRQAEPIIRFALLEAELQPKRDVNELEPISDFLGEMSGLEPEHNSKFIQALLSISERLSENDEFIQPTTSIAEVLRYVWRKQYLQMLLLEGSVRRDDHIEHVHEMRVAIRRMRAAHLLLKEYFRDATIEPLITGLKMTARKLGKVRDLDVALQKLTRYSKRLSDEDKVALKPLFRHWQKERTQYFQELLTWLDSKAYRQLLVALRQFVDTPGQGVKKRFTQLHQPPEAVQIRHVLSSMLLNRFMAVRKYEALFDAQQLEDETEQITIEIDTLHMLRIECKYLRYALEFTPELLGAEGQDFIKQLKKLQDLLGDLNDASVAKEMLTALPKKVRTRSVKQYMSRQNKVIRKTQKQVESALRSFLSQEDRERLGVMIARI